MISRANLWAWFDRVSSSDSPVDQLSRGGLSGDWDLVAIECFAILLESLTEFWEYVGCWIYTSTPMPPHLSLLALPPRSLGLGCGHVQFLAGAFFSALFVYANIFRSMGGAAHRWALPLFGSFVARTTGAHIG